MSGVPGSGKTTLCRLLNEYGYRCTSLVEIGISLGCIKGEEADIDCLRAKLVPSQYTIIEGHYAHLMKCSHAIILERGMEDLRRVYESRGYEIEKINENMEVQESGTIYSEALDTLPSTKIFTVKNIGIMDEVVSNVRQILDKILA
ncbi:AAA family ATPase [Oxyplasma meridianum]|uniref:AAA family ATPase n=1 Tax=Oxyplasma meridianum TaxID=3073602 RepID=A0AAX4NG90_9ARCH